MEIIKDLEIHKNITFTKQQKEAMMHNKGAALVLAVPGGGKTTTLMGRTAHLLHEKFATPAEILSITFSKASADDMTKRFATLFDFANFSYVKFSTIHSFAYGVIRSYGRYKGVEYTLIEGNNKKGISKYQILRTIYRNLTKNFLSENELDILIHYLGYTKNIMADGKEMERLSKQLSREDGIYQFTEVCKQYEKEKRKYNFLDFDDLLTFSYEILSENPDILQHYQQRYKYIQIDEGQDTSLVQHMIIKLLAKEHENVFYVADDDQSIYRFRGSSPQYLLDFESNYRHPKIYRMEQNFRSTQQIVNLANRFIKKNTTRYEKNISTENEKGKDIQINYTNEIEKLVDKIEKEKCLSNHAILYRENLSALQVVPILMKRKIPFHIKDFGKLFFTHWAVQDIFAISEFAIDDSKIHLFEKFYYKLSGYYIAKEMIEAIKKDTSNLSTYDKLKKVAKNEIGKKNIDRLEKQIKNLINMKPKTAIEYIVQDLGYGDFLLKRDGSSTKLEDVKAYQFIKALDSLCADIQSFCELENYMDDVKDAIQQATENQEKDGIRLSTLHSSKGLEWENVYLIDVKDGKFPSNKVLEDMNIEEIEEERRLCYVGITRAKKKLEIYGEKGSFFVEEILDILEPNRKDRGQFGFKNIIFKNSREDRNKKETRSKINNSIQPRKAKGAKLTYEELEEGMLIQHASFGEGKITKFDTSMIYIRFAKGKEKKLSTSFCLENQVITKSIE